MVDPKIRGSRIKKIALDPRLLPHLFVTGAALRCVSGLPAGFVFRGFAHDYHTNCINLFIEHPSFEIVLEGIEVPYFDPTPTFENIK